MKYTVIIQRDGVRKHEVIERQEGENCQVLRQTSSGVILSEEKTGPDCDEVHEVQS